jgi:hypothetical protein
LLRDILVTVFKLKLPTRPKTVKDLRLVRFWFCELARVHFIKAQTQPPFIYSFFVDALFSNEESTFISLGELTIYSLQNSVLPSIAALTRTDTLRCNPLLLDDGLSTLFSELLLASKQGVSKVLFSREARVNIRNLTEVFLYQFC